MQRPSNRSHQRDRIASGLVSHQAIDSRGFAAKSVFIIAAGAALGTLSWLGFPHLNIYLSKQALQTTVTPQTDLKALLHHQKELQYYRARLADIQNSPLFPYDAAQALLPTLADKSALIDQQVDDYQAFTQALDIAMGAAQKVQNPPHPVALWEAAQNDWMQAIAYLSQIETDSFLYAQAQSKLSDYQGNLAQIKVRFKTEKQAEENYQKANGIIQDITGRLSFSPLKTTGEDFVVRNRGLLNPTDQLIAIRNELSRAMALYRTVPPNTFHHESASKKLAVYRHDDDFLDKMINGRCDLFSCRVPISTGSFIAEAFEPTQNSINP